MMRAIQLTVMCVCLWAPMRLTWAQSDANTRFSAPNPSSTEQQIDESSWIQMFGVRLSSVTREEMRQALHVQGIKLIREDARYWVDVYDAKGLLNGATKFYVGYAASSQQLAFAEYAFANFMDSNHTAHIVKMVTAKYGPSAETVGQLDMGSYTARWRIPDGMQIQVVREWPETSTYLKFTNTQVESEMKAELDKETVSRQKNKLALDVGKSLSVSTSR